MMFRNVPFLLLISQAFGDAAPSRNNVRGLQTEAELDEARTCNGVVTGLGSDLDFIVLENDSTGLVIEDDIRANLAEIGIFVKLRKLNKEAFNAAHQSGDFSLSFTETWGAPYDPHSYASGWIAGDEGHFQAFSNLQAPATRDELFGLITDALQEESAVVRQEKWDDVHRYYHEQAVMLPLWGKRVPALLNPRLSGYEAGYQQFDYPVHTLVPTSGSSTVTIAPGAQTGMFQTVGRLDPHTYRPNEFFSSNWVYEGLVTYGEGGQILPSLAQSWTIADSDSGGEIYTFKLREGVSFHDGEPWNCAAAKLNFDHVLAGGLVGPDWHGWYVTPGVLESWSCSDDMTFVVTAKSKYAPLMQEMSFIRPLRMLSPGSFVQGLASDPFTHNSCHVGWGVVTDDAYPDVTCAGITGPSGTGPFAFDSRVEKLDDAGEPIGIDESVTFKQNTNYWNGVPAIERLKIVHYETPEDAKAALLDGSLDVIWGSGVLPDKDVAAIRDDTSNDIQVFVGDDIQNVLMLMNTGKPPLDSLDFRRAVIHAIDKDAIVQKELGGLQQTVNQVFPLDAPNSDVALRPILEYNMVEAITFSKAGCGITLCLPSETMVTDEFRGDIPLSDLAIGDYIHTGDGHYERVYSFGHKQLDVTAKYLSMVVKGLDKPVELSPDHLVFVNKEKSVPASSVQVGDHLYLGSTKNTEAALEVTKIHTKNKRGAFAPFTPSGKFVANGAVVSSYVTLNDDSHLGFFSLQWIASIFEAPHRLVCAVNFDVCRNEKYDADGVSTWVAEPRRFFLWVLEQHAVVQVLVLAPVLVVGTMSWMIESLFASGAAVVVALLSIGLVATGGWKMLFGKEKL